MVSKLITTGWENEAQELDEGWWASVMADEDAYLSPAKENNLKQNGQHAVAPVDWELVRRLYEQDEIVCLRVYGFNRGGLLVQAEGIQGFIPVSHLVEMPTNTSEDERHAILSGYVDRILQLKVIECEPSQERIVLSERAALSGEGCRNQLFRSLHPGAVVEGTVTNVTEFGSFIDLGGVEGLIHVSELSWGRVQHPSDIVQVGQRVRVLVLQVSEENSRIALSLKQLQANPWDILVKRYKPGDIIPAKITSITRFGAFAYLDEGVEGLIHVSSLDGGNLLALGDAVHPGAQVQVRILHIDPERRRLGLGLALTE